MTFKNLAEWIASTGCSVHIRATGDRFVVVAHRPQETRAADCTDRDLERALQTVLLEF